MLNKEVCVATCRGRWGDISITRLVFGSEAHCYEYLRLKFKSPQRAQVRVWTHVSEENRDGVSFRNRQARPTSLWCFNRDCNRGGYRTGPPIKQILNPLLRDVLED